MINCFESDSHRYDGCVTELVEKHHEDICQDQGMGVILQELKMLLTPDVI